MKIVNSISKGLSKLLPVAHLKGEGYCLEVIKRGGKVEAVVFSLACHVRGKVKELASIELDRKMVKELIKDLQELIDILPE